MPTVMPQPPLAPATDFVLEHPYIQLVVYFNVKVDKVRIWKVYGHDKCFDETYPIAVAREQYRDFVRRGYLPW